MDTTPDRLAITYKGQPRQLFMSFLRLNSCLRVIGDMSNVAVLMVDPDLAENVLRVMLAENGGAGGMFEYELNETDVSGEDTDRILLWVQDHLTAFFVKRFQQSQETVKKLEPVMKDLASQAAGSEG